MSWQGNNEDNGFNAEEYMSDVNEQEGADTTWEGLSSSLWGDFNKTQDQWKDSRDRLEAWHEREQGIPQMLKDMYGEYNEGQEKAFGAQQDLLDEYDESMEEYGERDIQRAEQYGSKIKNVFSQGSEIIRNLSQLATKKAEDLEADLKDYGAASISGLVHGMTAKARASSEMRIDEARRSGASESVIQGIQYESDREVSEGLQGSIAGAAQKWQESYQTAGRFTASAYDKEAQMESGLMTTELGIEETAYGATSGALDKATSLSLDAKKRNIEFNQYVMDSKNKSRSEELMTVAQAEIAAINNDLEYSQMLDESPAVKSSAVWATMLEYQSMPGFGRLSEMKNPVNVEKAKQQRAGANKRLLERRGFSNANIGDSLNLGNIDPKKFAAAVSSFRGTYHGMAMNIDEYLARKFSRQVKA